MLNLANNELTVLPPEIGQLTNLMRLGLIHNHLTTLPPEISQLTKLVGLGLGFNQLMALPVEIGQLTSLTELYLNGNQLTTLPIQIGQLINLTELYLRSNRLTALPLEIRQLTNLKELDLYGNKDLQIPPEILRQKQEPATIVNYYLQRQTGQQRPLNEAKMLMVGQGGVGKTSLIKQLVEGRFDPHEGKTEGIDIKRWPIRANGETIRLNVWDFGGQEILHATHQFFLTKRSLYVLVLDARQGEHDSQIEYWLKLIQSFGGESPIVVVINKTDEHALDIDERGLRAKYGTIKAFVRTSCKSGLGISDLKTIITEETSRLEHIHDQLLLSWFVVKTQLEEMKQDYIPYRDYQRMCKDANITDNLDQRTLIGFLHDLGIVLNFQDDRRLNDE